MRTRLALLASGLRRGIDYEHCEVDLKKKPPELLAVSPKGTVPVWVLPQQREAMGKVIDQSLDIMLWALRHNDPYHWLAHEKEAMPLIAHCDGDFKFHLDRYKYPNRYQGTDALEHRAKAAEFAAVMEAVIPTLVGEQNHKVEQGGFKFEGYFGLLYAGTMPFIRQFANTDGAWFNAQPWPHLQAALEQFQASNAFTSIMQVDGM